MSLGMETIFGMAKNRIKIEAFRDSMEQGCQTALDCLSDFLVAGIRHHGQGNLYKKAFDLGVHSSRAFCP